VPRRGREDGAAREAVGGGERRVGVVRRVFEAARQRLPGISYATVYNSLRYLKEAGLVLEINFGDSASRYDRELDRHDHAICNDCGKLVDFDLPDAAKLMNAAARKSRFKPQSVHLTLRGRCPDCCAGSHD